MSESPSKGQIRYAQADEEVFVVRVVGRGNHELSHNLKNLFERLNRKDYSPAYIIDLDRCVSLDSTFMGTMAAMALHQSSSRKDRSVVVNANATTGRQLAMLGLNYLLDIHATHASATNVGDEDFRKAESTEPLSRTDRIIHMIEAHQHLTDLSSGNELQFKGVLDALTDSLEQESMEQ